MKQTEFPKSLLDRWQLYSLVIGLAGVVLLVVGLLFNPAQFFRSYLFGYIFWVQIALGCLAILFIHHLSGGRWSYNIRRILEAGAMTLPLLALLFVPLLFGLPTLYEWTRPEAVAADPLLQHKLPYLNVPFFIIRTVVYFAVWLVTAFLLYRWAGQLDRSDQPMSMELRFKLVSGLGLGLIGLTVTFASFDWMMSLEPHWFSTIYGIMFGVGMLAAGFAFAVLLLAVLLRYPPLAEVVTPGNLNDLGNFLLTSVMLWAYIALSQYLIIWSGNLPEETPWYVSRTRGGWEWVGLLVIIFHFALPFLVLLSRTVKRRVFTLAVVAVVILIVRLVDLFWMIIPAFYPAGFYLHWLDLAAPLGLGGLWTGLFFWLLKRRTLLPVHDIRIEEEAFDHGRTEATTRSY